MFLLFLFLVVAGSVWATCPTGTYHIAHQNKCLAVISKESQDGFFESELDCRDRGGHLVSVDDAFTNALLFAYANGVNLTGNIFIGGKLKKSSWEWISGSKVKYTNWAKGQPVKGNNCIAMNLVNAKWNSVDCDEHDLPYFCEIPPKTPEPVCPPKWTMFNGSCYLYHNGYPNVQYSWEEARTFCRENDGDLASIHSPAENKFLTELAVPSKTNCGAHPYTWIGLQYNLNYLWSDKTDVVYNRVTTAEDPTRPKIHYTMYATCYERNGGQSQWKETFSSQTYYTLVCKRGPMPSQCS